MSNEPSERLIWLTAYCVGVGAGSTLPQLCRRLADQGLLSGSDVEELRHSALLGFDMLRERAPLSEMETDSLEEVRKHLDHLWQSAAISAERKR